MKAVIFDMDGVIVDTEPVNQQRILQYVRKFNSSAKEEDLNDIVGRGTKEVWDIVAKVSGSGKSAEEMKEEYRLQWIPRHCENIDYLKLFRPAVRDVLSYARTNGIRTAVASSTEYKKVKAILTEVGIFDSLDVVVSGEDCIRPKPYPDVYLETAKRLRVAPEECLVIEDSTVGIEAANQAGTRVAALIDHRFPFDRRKADVEIASVADAIPLMSKERKEKSAQ
ncbi:MULTISPECIES: HAD family hydrolase [Acutalibacteraceae]|uniref:HAD family hydrolase n=1 Tax=Acutalibacteraceae TaxID=3082771 RepID=UPI0013E8B0C0|nr:MULTISPECIES: HAD family phosphatase [Acutalibacteraceae]